MIPLDSPPVLLWDVENLATLEGKTKKEKKIKPCAAQSDFVGNLMNSC